MNSVQEKFVNDILPGIKRNANAYANCHGYDPEKREELIAETIATAWQQFITAKRKDLHAGHFWWIAIKRWQFGRHMASYSTTGLREGLADPIEEADEGVLFDDDPNPADEAAFRIDFETFKNCLTSLSRQLLMLKMAGHKVADMARLLRVPYRHVHHACHNLKRPAVLFFQPSLSMKGVP
ncbi:MAG: hypothetical protein HUU41_21975 [Bryobacteraceae bacterium]|nr:hypothetical protein [Bryobacteraceae bacterium]